MLSIGALQYIKQFAPVAQWIRASVFGTEGRTFESYRVYHRKNCLTQGSFFYEVLCVTLTFTFSLSLGILISVNITLTNERLHNEDEGNRRLWREL